MAKYCTLREIAGPEKPALISVWGSRGDQIGYPWGGKSGMWDGLMLPFSQLATEFILWGRVYSFVPLVSATQVIPDCENVHEGC